MTSSKDGFSKNDNDEGSGNSNFFGTGITMKELKVEYFMSKNPVTAHSNVNFPGAIDIMTTKGIGNLIVVENRVPIGVFTEREILYHLSYHGKLPTEILLGDIELQSFCKVNRKSTVLEAAKKMISEKCRILVFEDDDIDDVISNAGDLKPNSSAMPGTEYVHNKMTGIITASDMIRAFSKQIEKDPTLESVITRKIAYISVNDTVYDAINVMLNQNIGSVIVVDDNQENIGTGSSLMGNKKLHGIFTERDLLTKILSKDVNLGERIKRYCSTLVTTGDMQITGLLAANRMLMHKIKRLPLITETVTKIEEPNTATEIVILKDDKHKISGIVTARDLVELFQSG
jgi:CBS domain-containing protein